LASAARVGLSFLDELVFTDRFYVGGSNTVRGYREDDIGPRNLAQNAAGGNALLVLNQELRASILKWARAVAFVDAGNVFSSNADMSLGALQVGYGVGLRFDTPFSIFRIDVGWPHTPINGQRGARWYFGLGQIF
jgi:outer membrane protein insertion porin family